MRHSYFKSTAAAITVIAIMCRSLVAGEEKIPLDKLPKVVTDAVKKAYPKAELVEAVEETEHGETEYEVTVKENGKTIDVSLDAKGAILGTEKEIPASDLPNIIVKSLKKLYPKPEYKKVEVVHRMENGKLVVDYYEIAVQTDQGKTEEVKINRDGEIRPEEDEEAWSDDFSAEKGQLTSTGRNPYFILEPGYQLVLEGKDDRLVITVLDETKMIDGVETRVVEERETEKGALVEVSRNFYAICKRTNSVYYFGEEVDIYKDGKISGHEGSWQSGVNGAKFGLMMPGLPLLEAKFYQEIAPKVAMDRAEIDSVSETVTVPAGTFKNCLRVEESTPLEPGKEESKLYAPGIGLLTDGDLKLVKYGKVESPKK